jgi:hypothetical protein
MKCIYCKDDITETNKSEEHVFPESFGCPNNWTMDCVCIKCNNDFGKTIERYLAGDSIAGLWRLQKIGSRSKKPVKQTRIKINIPNEEKYGEFIGAIVYFDFSKKDSLLLPSQILIKDEQGNRKFFLVEDIERDDVKNELNKHKDRGFWIFAHNADNERTAIEKLKQIGIEFKPIKEEKLPISALEDDGKFKVIVEGIMDNMIFRAIAKIAFNYLAKVKGHDCVLDSKFDIIREYIKSGTKPNFNIVKIEEGHILADETNDKYFFEGHIFTIQSQGNRIFGKVSLSNTFAFYYVVDLGELGPIWYELKSGHAYSLKEAKIIPLFSSTFIIPYKAHRKLLY